jgi:uncharacterized protein YgiM (DUF1202 family)
MRVWVLLIAICVSTSVRSEEPKNLGEAMDGLAKDLSSLQRNVQSAADPKWTYSPGRLRITQSSAAVYKGADFKSGVVTKLPEGSSAPIIDKAGEWYAITVKDGKNPMTGWVPAGSAAPEPAAFGPFPVNGADVYDAAMDQIKALKEKYEKNPYIKITGFSVDVKVPPGVSVEFEFK